MPNPGSKLFFSRFGGEQPIPPEFIAAMAREEEVQSLGDSTTGPEPLSDTIVESKVETNRNNERVRTTIKKRAGIITLQGFNTNEHGQAVQVTRRLVPTGSPQTPATATTTVATQDLGNGWSIEEIGVAGAFDDDGNFVPAPFLGAEYSREIPDLTPERFRPTVPTDTTQTTIAGIAAPPTLGPNEFERKETQQTSFLKRVFVKFRNAITLPVSQTNYQTNEVQQLEQVQDTLQLDDPVPEQPTATTDIKTENLGAGVILKTKTIRSEVFPAAAHEIVVTDITPDEFKAGIATRTDETESAGTIDPAPVLATGEILHREEQKTKLVKRIIRRFRDFITLPQSFRNYETNEDRQTVIVQRTLEIDPGTAPADASATVSVESKVLGDGTRVRTTKDIGTVLAKPSFETFIPDVVPEIFRPAIPTTRAATNIAGQATAPTLLPGDLRRSEQQLDLFTKRVESEGRADLVVPVSLTGKETNDKKQIVSVVQTYRDVGVDAAPSPTQDVEVRPLGSNRVLEIRKTVPSVFADAEYIALIEDTVPPEFRSLVPKRTTEVTSFGLAAPPNLGAGELERSVRQLDTFNMRTRVTKRDTTTLPQTLQDKRYDGLSTEEGKFAGTVVSNRTLDNASSLNVGLQILQSITQAVGDGTFVNRTDTILAYPVLTDKITDLNTGIVTTRSKAIIAAGTPIVSGFQSVKAIDDQRSLRITESVNITDFDINTNLKQFGGQIDVDGLPPQLISVTGIMNADLGLGTYSENGTYALTGRGSGGVALHGTVRGSGAVLPDITFIVKHPTGQGVPCQHYVFYVPNGTATATMLSLLTARIGILFSPWPKFVPEAVTILCKGEKVNGDATVNVNASDAVNTDSSGAVVLSSSTRTTGTGKSFEMGLSNKVVVIPPTIHAALTIGGSVTAFQDFTSVSTISSGVNSNIIGLNGRANGSITPTTIAATAGQSTLPTTGWYAYRILTEPARYNLILVHIVAVNFGNIV